MSEKLDVETTPRSGVIAGFVAGGVMFGTLALTFPFIALPTAKKGGLPFMATPGNKVKKALEFIKKKSGRQNSTFLDLGSGDGEAVYQAVKVISHKTKSHSSQKPWEESSTLRCIYYRLFGVYHGQETKDYDHLSNVLISGSIL